MNTTMPPKPQAILVLPHISVEEANAVSAAFTHGMPSMGAFHGYMLALQRKMAQNGLALTLSGVGVICHKIDEQVQQPANPFHHGRFIQRKRAASIGTTIATIRNGGDLPFVETGMAHLEITLIFGVHETHQDVEHNQGRLLVPGRKDEMDRMASRIQDITESMRVAGGRPTVACRVEARLSRRTRAWMELVSSDEEIHEAQVYGWRRQWLPGFALVSREDWWDKSKAALQARGEDSSQFKAFMNGVAFTKEPDHQNEKGQWQWINKLRPQGAGWVVPIPVGYRAISPIFGPKHFRNARDATTPTQFVEPIYSFGEWISQHHLTSVAQLLWYPDNDLEAGIYRLRNAYQHIDDEFADEDIDTGIDVDEDTEIVGFDADEPDA